MLKFNCSCTIIAFFVLLLLNVSVAQNKTKTIELESYRKNLPFGLVSNHPVAMPKLGLALSGGGARGLAAVGCLKAFVEEGIDIDVIAGTSMGSIVGGLFSLGYSINELDSIALNTHWDNLISLENKTDRRELFVEQKVAEDKAILSIRFDNFKLVFPNSVNDGLRFSNYLNLLTLQAPIKDQDDFSKLETNFGAVCTNLETGDLVLLNRGSMGQALRASSSVSFLLSPVVLDSMLLVDGGLVANVPVKVAKQLGADIVVAVNTTSELYKKKELDAPWFLADQLVSIPMRLLNEAQLKEADFIITPKIEGYLSTDFARVDSIMHKGYLTTIPNINSVKNRVDSLFRKNLQFNEFFIKNVKFDSNATIGKEYLENYIKLDSVSSAQIKYDIFLLNKNKKFSNVKCIVEEKTDGNYLRFTAEENPIINSVVVNKVGHLDSTQLGIALSELLFSPFDPVSIATAIKKILSEYRSRGLSLAELKSIKFDDSSGRLTLLFDEGRISKLILTGNKITNSTVIMREFPLRVGDLFSFDNVQQGLSNLRNTNLFQSVIIEVEKDSIGNILTLDINEKPPSLLRLGFKVDNENKASVSFDLRNENLFGTGTELGLLVLFSSMEKSYTLEQKSVRVFDTYFTYSINGFYKIKDILHYVNDISTSSNFFSRSSDGEYRQIFYGLSLAIGTQISRFGNFIISANYGNDEVKNIKESPISNYKMTLTTLKTSLSIDTHDKYPYPLTGVKLNAYYETAQSLLGGELGYTDFNMNYSIYYSLNENHTFSTSLRFAFADKTLPLSRQYSLGGQYSFFGMRENEYRGRQILKSSFEYRVLLPFQLFFNTYFMFRYDLGSIWTVQEEIRFTDFRHGVGGTISIDTPIGPADFSIGRSFFFKKNVSESPVSLGPVYFYFSIGFYY